MRYLMLIGALICCGGCSRFLGWGVLVWSTEDPAIPSGTVLPVYIKSTLNQVWVVGVPAEYRNGSLDKMEIPLPKLQLVGTEQRAKKQAQAFADYALVYAETLQDGLPIREEARNSAKRVYRLRMKERVKVLSLAEGQAALSGTGEALPGSWYYVMTEDGTRGYCFSYRLSLFEYSGGSAAVYSAEPEAVDGELDAVLAKTWVPDFYAAMIESGHIDLDALSMRWGFFSDHDTGTVRVYTPTADMSFTYHAIRAIGEQTWNFEGSTLSLRLRADNQIAVSYQGEYDVTQTNLFTAIDSSIEDIIVQERNRRSLLYRELFQRGPIFFSNYYGFLSLDSNGYFMWTGYDLLVPHVISATSSRNGIIRMDTFMDQSLQPLFDGAFSMHFDGQSGGQGSIVSFLYNVDTDGLRIEYAAPAHRDGNTIVRRDVSPFVIYFYKIDIPFVPVDEPNLPEERTPSEPSESFSDIYEHSDEWWY
ncbi:hypothetical protein PilKf_00303 [Pillotina sp. SPG140]|jgi:hypothetical protein